MMQTRLLLSGLFLCLISGLSSQSMFQKVYGSANGGQGNSIISTMGGGYAIAGWYDVDGLFSAEFYLINIDHSGDTLWTKSFGKRADTSAFVQNGSGNEGYHIVQTTDGGFLFVGERHEVAGGTSDAYAVRISPSGELLWSRMYGGDDNEYGVSVVQTADGNFVIGGFTETFGAGIRDMLLFKIDTDGDTMWTRTYGGASIDAAMQMKQTSDGGFVLVGYTFSFGAGSSDVYVVRTDDAGNVLWQKTFGENLNEIGHSIIETNDSGFLICGETESFGGGNRDVYLVKISDTGELEWSRAYGGDGYEAGISVTQSPDWGYAIAGYTRGYGAGGEDFFVLKSDSQGSFEWAKTFGGTSDDAAKSIISTDDHGYAITGYSRSFGSGVLDVYLVKTDSLGNSTCGESISNIKTIDIASIENVPNSLVGFGTIIKERNTVTGRTNTTVLDPCDSLNSIAEIDFANSISLFPNPADDLISIKLLGGGRNSRYGLVIFDRLGRRMLTDVFFGDNIEVDITSLSAGPYYLNLQVGDKFFSKMFVKQ